MVRLRHDEGRAGLQGGRHGPTASQDGNTPTSAVEGKMHQYIVVSFVCFAAYQGRLFTCVFSILMMVAAWRHLGALEVWYSLCCMDGVTSLWKAATSCWFPFGFGFGSKALYDFRLLYS